MTEPQPTQIRHPRRATIRTAVAAAVGLISIMPLIIAGAHLDSTYYGAQVAAVTTIITRVLAIPAVNDWVAENLPWLAPTPRQP